MKIKLIVIHLGFTLTGIVTTMLGPLLPLLAARWSLNDAQAGRLFMAQFVSSVTGSLVASRVLSRWGAGWTVLIGMFLIAGGVVSVGAKMFALGVAGICVFGVGLGFALPSTNLLVAELVPAGRVSALNLLNFAWTVGALTAPLTISALLKSVGLRGFLLALGAAFLVIAMTEARVFPKSAGVASQLRHGKLLAEQRFHFALLTTIFLFLYVGVENGFAGWVSALSIRTQQTSQAATAIVQSSFWGGILLGRLVAPLVVRALVPGTLILTGLLSAALGIAVSILSPSLILLVSGVALSGLGLAAVFPTTAAIFAEWYGTGGAGSVVLGVCGLGGALIPWLVGAVSLQAHSLRVGLVVTLVCTGLAILVFWRMQPLVQDR